MKKTEYFIWMFAASSVLCILKMKIFSPSSLKLALQLFEGFGKEKVTVSPEKLIVFEYKENTILLVFSGFH